MSKSNSGGALPQEAQVLRKLASQLAALQDMRLADLQAQHLELFGIPSPSKNLPFLRRKLAFRLQERLEGGISPEAQDRIASLAPKELPTRATRSAKAPLEPSLAPPSPQATRDPRLPLAGTVLQRTHQGFVHEVQVLEDTFLYRGRTYTSLSTIAREITGTSWNGFTFFGLAGRRHA